MAVQLPVVDDPAVDVVQPIRHYPTLFGRPSTHGSGIL